MKDIVLHGLIQKKLNESVQKVTVNHTWHNVAVYINICTMHIPIDVEHKHIEIYNIIFYLYVHSTCTKLYEHKNLDVIFLNFLSNI